MNKLLIAAFSVALLASPALAKGGKAPVQNHHCVKAGATLKETHKQCTKDGGKWVRDDAAPAAKSNAPAPATTPTPAPAPAKAP